MTPLTGDNVGGFVARGIAYQNLGDFVAAKSDFEEAAKLGAASSYVALAAKGHTMILNGKPREGFGEIAKAQKSAKNDVRVALTHAQALTEQGKWSQAELAWKQVLKTVLRAAELAQGNKREMCLEHANRFADSKHLDLAELFQRKYFFCSLSLADVPLGSPPTQTTRTGPYRVPADLADPQNQKSKRARALEASSLSVQHLGVRRHWTASQLNCYQLPPFHFPTLI